ncbi:MAG: hypothetical protein V3W09_04085, partial [Nitrososphaerales archaeon]
MALKDDSGVFVEEAPAQVPGEKAELTPKEFQAKARSAIDEVIDPGGSVPLDTRMILSFAEKPEERMKILQRAFGEENVIRTSEDEFAFRKSPQENFQRVDERGLSLGDFIDLIGEAPVFAGAAAGAAVGGIPGAAVGGFAGRIGKEILRKELGASEPGTTLGAESVKKAAVSGAVEGVGEAAGGLATAAMGKFLAPFKSGILPEAQAAQELIGTQGGQLTPAQLTESRT